MKFIYLALVVLAFFALFGCTRNTNSVTIQEQKNVTNTSYSNGSIHNITNSTPSYQVNVGLPLPPNVSSSNQSVNSSTTITNVSNSTNVIVNVGQNISVNPIVPLPPCVDSDSNNISNAGYVDFQGKRFYDICTGEENVKEYLCTNNTLDNYITQCPFDYECKSGACSIVQQICTDSDGGKDIFVSGTVTIKDSSGRLLNTKDKCTDIYNVQEYYCNGNQVAYDILPCTGNYTCNVDTGACNFK